MREKERDSKEVSRVITGKRCVDGWLNGTRASDPKERRLETSMERQRPFASIT